MTDRDRAVVLRWLDRCLVVSPGRPDESAADELCSVKGQVEYLLRQAVQKSLKAAAEYRETG